MSATYYLFRKELLSSGIGVSAFPDMGSLVLNYIHVGTSAQLLYLLRNVDMHKCQHLTIAMLEYISLCINLSYFRKS